MKEEEIREMQAEIERLRADNARLQSEMIRLVSRNLNLSEQLEVDVELRRRFEAARTLMKEHIERQRNADLQDDGQLLALIDLRLEEKRSHLNPDFDTKQLAELIGVSQERLNRLFRNKSIYRTPEAYIDNLRTINAMRLLRTQPNYSIAAIAEASGFNHVRTLQRRIMDVTGMTPADYRALFTTGYHSSNPQNEIYFQTTHATHHDSGIGNDGRHCRSGVCHRRGVHGGRSPAAF